MHVVRQNESFTFGGNWSAELQLRRTLKASIKVIGVSRSGSEISCDVSDENKITRILLRGHYDAIINAVAQTDINRCEIDPLESWKINAKIVSLLTNLATS